MAKNNTIWIWRIVFTYIIAIYHLNNLYNIVSGWYIGVEFFFIVSGFLLAKHICENEQVTPWGYTIKRVLYFVPIYFINGIARLTYDVVSRGESIKYFGYKCIESIPDFLFVYLFGGSDSLNPVVWYINALLAGGCIIAYLLKYHRRSYVNIIAPFSALLIYGWLVRYTGCVEGYGAHNSLYKDVANYLMLLRGFAGLSVGVLVYTVSEKIVLLRADKFLNRVTQIIEPIGYIVVLLMSFWHGRKTWDVTYLLVLAILVGLSFTNQICHKLVCNTLVKWMNSISVYIYLCHYWIRDVFRDYLGYTISTYLLYIVSITVVASLQYMLVESIKHIWLKKKDVLKK